jgi:hypothetical protein
MSDDPILEFVCFFSLILFLAVSIVSGVWLLALPFIPIMFLCWWLDKKVFPEKP